MARDYKFRWRLVFAMVWLCCSGVAADYGPNDYLLMARPRDIVKYHLQTGAVEVVTTSLALAIDYDPVEEYIYFSKAFGNGINDIWRVHLDGSGEEIFVRGVRNSWGLALDWENRKLYWSNNDEEPLVEVINLDGSNRTFLLGCEHGILRPTDVALDLHRGYLYIADAWYVRRTRLDGSGLEVVVSGLDDTLGLAVHSLCPARVYWADHDTGHLGAALMDGSYPRNILTFNAYPEGRVFALTVMDDYVYWADFIAQAIYRADRLTGDNIITIDLPIDYTFNTYDMKAVHLSA